MEGGVTGSVQEFVDVEEAMRITGHSRPTLDRMARAGKLPKFYVQGAGDRGAVRFKIGDLKRLFQPAMQPQVQ